MFGMGTGVTLVLWAPREGGESLTHSVPIGVDMADKSLNNINGVVLDTTNN